MRQLLLFVVLLCLTALPVHGQDEIPSLSDAASVSMVTILPGPSVEALFGHSALRVEDPELDIDRLYNYGTFDFDDPFFIPKFLYGDLQYFLSVSDGSWLPRYASQFGRPVVEQHLQLSQHQTQQIFEFLEVNARPENRYYRYDFYFDNCSTRILDLFEDVLGDEVDFNYTGELTSSTFRDLLRPYIIGQRHVQSGMNVLLGLPSDERATDREWGFLPDHLYDLFDQGEVMIDGAAVPLVTETDTVAWVEGYERPEPGIDWVALLGWLVAIWSGVLAYREWRSPECIATRLHRWFDGVFLFVAGLIGLALTFLWTISLHTVTHPNLNVLWAWPTHILLLPWLLRARPQPWQRVYLAVACIVAALVVIAWALLPQDLPAVALPLSLALAIRTGSRWHHGGGHLSG